ncbi:cytochrome c oxidase assembly protein [Methylocella sp. CPCC 101449]|jgi:cytochrome c oxidase assembly protein subunit 11|uniref:cytochrome c oxidase assembly protein n=1 Tax=Methylocella sp. CPCC 101449 TaxID=2987531 RepID=UPI00288C6996|nr:cytochrome c oxidase assembly protein [Methylocella sp. CPCC 101449]MDT2020235.1 cytochrome c oxidase assembly protein [Methylocella sp. CPCC 101449]HEV2574825.1 cytochrome c oxidase assembly protein [Beijerinckiaceae bacterium]
MSELPDDQVTTKTPQARAHRRIAIAVAGTSLFMLGMSFAAVPLYEMFCRTTGFGGTPIIAKGPATGVGERTLTVRFDANVGGGIPWTFEPEIGQMRLRTGETATVFYKVVNKSDKPVTGIATYNVAPDQVGGFFNKISCFCFTEQTLGPGETMDMPVVFYLDPALENEETMRQVQSLTLSYTFMPVRQKSPVAAAKEADKANL